MTASLSGALAWLDPAPKQRQQARDALQDWLARDAAVALDPAVQNDRADSGTQRHTERFLAQGSMTEELNALVELAATEQDKPPTREIFLSLLSRQPGSSISGQLAAGPGPARPRGRRQTQRPAAYCSGR